MHNYPEKDPLLKPAEKIKVERKKHYKEKNYFETKNEQKSKTKPKK